VATLSAARSDDDPTPTYPGARRPDRRRWVTTDGLALAVYEWGDESAPPLLAAHGGFDFAGTFDGFAPLLADAGWRVVSWDQRGHGDSDRSVLYSWDADLRDMVAVLDTVTTDPLPALGHSKGGALVTQLADACPFRVSHIVNLDGLPSRRAWPDVPERERTRLLAGEVRAWLDHRQAAATKSRRPDTLDGLARRRQAMNPRLSLEWLRYIATIGARQDPDGWRWKIDPSMRFGGFGPWRPEWTIQRIPGLGMPMLGVLGMETEAMGWGTLAEDVPPYLPAGARFEPLEGVGHFVHIEQPERVAGIVLDFLGPPADAGRWPEATEATTQVVHNRAHLALHRLRDGEGGTLLHLHGLGERPPRDVPASVDGWTGPIWGLDFTGHGGSTRSTGGGYTAEVLLADVDTALRHLGPATVFGRGLGGYVALLIAGARPDLVRGAIVADGPGLFGGGAGPVASLLTGFEARPAIPGRPDPYVLSELARDPRPADYASAFVRLALNGSSLATPVAVVAEARPEWLTAVLVEPGVEEMSVTDALELYRRESTNAG
jgi:pimeloyl-ACP methyl ester carboxylesterase